MVAVTTLWRGGGRPFLRGESTHNTPALFHGGVRSAGRLTISSLRAPRRVIIVRRGKTPRRSHTTRTRARRKTFVDGGEFEGGEQSGRET